MHTYIHTYTPHIHTYTSTYTHTDTHIHTCHTHIRAHLENTTSFHACYLTDGALHDASCSPSTAAHILYISMGANTFLLTQAAASHDDSPLSHYPLGLMIWVSSQVVQIKPAPTSSSQISQLSVLSVARNG